MSYDGDELSGMELFDMENGVEEGLAFEEDQEEYEELEKQMDLKQKVSPILLIHERMEHYKNLEYQLNPYDRYGVQMILKELYFIKENM